MLLSALAERLIYGDGDTFSRQMRWQQVYSFLPKRGTTRLQPTMNENALHIPMPEGVCLSPALPQWVRLAIADAVVLFGRTEQETTEIAWLLTDATLREKLKLARNPATDNFLTVLEAVEQQAPDLRLDELKNGFTALAQERNLIVHGAWTMVDEKPWVVWHRFLEDDDSIIGEYFEAWRFQRFTTKGEHLLGMLRRFHDMLEEQTGKKTSAVPRT